MRNVENLWVSRIKRNLKSVVLLQDAEYREEEPEEEQQRGESV